MRVTRAGRVIPLDDGHEAIEQLKLRRVHARLGTHFENFILQFIFDFDKPAAK